MNIIDKFNKHPFENNETYLQHLYRAVRLSFSLFRISFYCIIHAFFPFIFVQSASTGIDYIRENYLHGQD